MPLRRFFLASAAVLALAGCLDEGSTEAAMQATAESRASYVAAALVNYAMANAGSGMAAGHVTKGGGNVPVHSMLCAKDDGKGLYLAWLPEALPDRGIIAVAAAQRLGAASIAQAGPDGKLYAQRQLLALPAGCDMPQLAPGSPVIVLPVSLPNSEAGEGVTEETRSQSCPEGYVGALIQSRRVIKRKGAAPDVGAWETADMGGCEPFDAVTTTQERVTLDAWENAGGSDIETALTENQPRDCVRTTITHDAAGQRRSKKVIDTCAGEPLPARLTVAEPAEVEKPSPYTYTTAAAPGLCADGTPALEAALPSMGTVAEYAAALAGYQPELDAMNAGGNYGCIRLSSVAHWPFWQTFEAYRIKDVYCPPSGRIAYPYPWSREVGCPAGQVYTREAAPSPLIRLFKVKLPMSFEAARGSSAWIEKHITPYGYSDNFRSFPAAWRSDSEHWFRADFTASPSVVLVFSMDGRGYSEFVGDNTATGAHRGDAVPVPYANQVGDAWGNTAEQAAQSGGISYTEFADPVFHYEAAGSQ